MPTLDFTLAVPSSFPFSSLHQSPFSQNPLPFSTSHPAAGFGEYENFSPQDFAAYQTAQKMHTLMMATLLGMTAVGMIIATASFPTLAWVTPFTFLIITIQSVRTYLNDRALLNHFPPDLTKELNPRNFGGRCTGEYILENGSSLILANGVESKKYKHDLMRQAQQSIFLSCYMGEETLDETLHLIQEQMQQKSDLKVFILSSDHFLTSENRRRLECLKTTYPNRFFLVQNPEVYCSKHPKEGRFLLSTNHIKLTVIDQGAYWIVGGCALRPFWSKITGEDHLEKYMPQRLFDIYNPLEAKGFRDMDFMFNSAPRGAGMTAFLEGAKLMLRYAYMQDPALANQLKQQFLELMQKPIPLTRVPSFDTHPEKITQNVGLKLYATGPDHSTNPYLHDLIHLIDNAREKIVIAHMYFHPPQSFIDALLRAVERGVKIELITNSKDKAAPLAHRFFSDLAQCKYRQLFEGKRQHNVKVFEFYRANTTYHKKVIIVDQRYTAFGSTNLGTKSLEENPDDYELNCIVESVPFSEKTMYVLQKDIALSHPISADRAKSPSCDTRLFAFFQEHIMTHIL